MAKDPLREALDKRYSRTHVNRLITAKASERFLTRRLAMLAVARDVKVPNWVKYAADDEMATLRANDAGRGPAQAAVAPVPAAPVRPRPTSRATPGPRVRATTKMQGRQDKVFVVHGRDSAISDSMFAFLRAVGLDPVEWGVAMHQTGKGMPNIAETIDAGLAGIAAVVVVLTPDDDVVLKERFHTDHDPDDEKKLTGQARPNVLFEGGLAFGRYPTKTIFVSVGKVKGFTDLGGFHITRLNNTAPKRSELVTKLRTAGADAQTDGREHWYNAGDFEIKEDHHDGDK